MKARVGGMSNVAHVGGTRNVAHVGGMRNVARVGGMRNVARVGGMRNESTYFQAGNLRRRDHSEIRRVRESIILKWIFKR